MIARSIPARETGLIIPYNAQNSQKPPAPLRCAARLLRNLRMSALRRYLLPLFIAALLPALAARAQDKPIAPDKAAAHMTLPDGFRATLFAGEPDVVQPIALTIDDRGRLWVVECFSYPNWQRSGEGKDRILIFEDRNGNGHFDTCKVFCGQGHQPLRHRSSASAASGCAPRRTCCSSPTATATTSPPARPRWCWTAGTSKAKHNVFNSLTWGPDGWLYGCNGILSNSHVGKPGTPDDQRVPLNCGVWRYHPTRKVVRGRRPGHHQPVGPRLRRLRRDVHHQLRHQAPLARHARGPLPAHVRPGPEPQPATA